MNLNEYNHTIDLSEIDCGDVTMGIVFATISELIEFPTTVKVLKLPSKSCNIPMQPLIALERIEYDTNCQLTVLGVKIRGKHEWCS